MSHRGDVTLSHVVRGVAQLAASGEPMTLLGICPMSEEIIRAAIELAVQHDFPVIFIASRNQVSEDEGGGYCMGFTQESFIRAIEKMEAACGVNSAGTRPYLRYVSVDHCGPWYKEREKSLGKKEALQSVRRSLSACVHAGYAGIHIDCSFKPPAHVIIDEAAVIELTADLFEYTENERKALGKPPLSYEIGTEETAGAGISAEHFRESIRRILRELEKRSLPKPDFVVGRTGAKIEMLHNTGFDYTAAGSLPPVAAELGMGFKEHNADYLSTVILSLHPEYGITGANVGPGFAAAQTRALLNLAAVEENRVTSGRSGFYRVMSKAVLEKAPFHKWLGKAGNWTAEELRQMPGQLRAVTTVCGHYTYHEPTVRAATEAMYRNLKQGGIIPEPEAHVMCAVKNAIMQYVDSFNLCGSTSKILNEDGGLSS